jgi:hypothetical protein
MIERLKLPGRPKGSKDKSKSCPEAGIRKWCDRVSSCAAFGQDAPIPASTKLDCAGHEAWSSTDIKQDASHFGGQMPLLDALRYKLQEYPARQPTSHATAAPSAHGASVTPSASRPAAASTTASTSPWPWHHVSIEEAVAPLPVSSRADDPFHDEWRYWPREARDPPAALRSESVLRSGFCPRG